MSLTRVFRRAVSVALCAMVWSGFAVPVRAAAMQPWSGASASTSVFAQNDSQQGATATASGVGSNNVEYHGRTYPDQTFHTVVSGSASASASGLPDQLLSVQTQYGAPNPGTLGYNTGGGPVTASASWSNDAVILTPPVGGTMPDSVRLQFALKFAPVDQGPDSGVHFGTIQLTANNQPYSVTASYGNSPTAVPSGFDSVTTAANGQSTGTLHVDLPLSASGISDPFQLKLESHPGTDLESNAPLQVDHNAILSLKERDAPRRHLTQGAGLWRRLRVGHARLAERGPRAGLAGVLGAGGRRGVLGRAAAIRPQPPRRLIHE